MADEMTRQEFADYMEAFEERLGTRFARIESHLREHDSRFAQVDMRFDKVDARIDKVDERIDSLTHIMMVQFEDVRRDIRFSLEAVQGLRDVTERGFSEQRTEYGEQIALLQDVLRHVRGRVERLEPRARKRRS